MFFFARAASKTASLSSLSNAPPTKSCVSGPSDDCSSSALRERETVEDAYGELSVRSSVIILLVLTFSLTPTIFLQSDLRPPTSFALCRLVPLDLMLQ